MLNFFRKRKDCDYCSKKRNIIDNKVGLSAHVVGQRLNVQYNMTKLGCEISVFNDVYFCPMCGRRLANKNNKVEKLPEKINRRVRESLRKGE